MHEPLTDRIEEYLQGSTAIPGAEEHLSNCEACRKEVAEMRFHSSLLQSLQPGQEADPAAGFYARVLNRIEVQSRQSVWNIFSESLFAKRLAYASMTFFVLLGTYLVSTTETNKPYATTSPEVIIANDDHIHPAIVDNPQKDREVVLVSLASYQQ